MLNNSNDLPRLYSKENFRAFHDEIFNGYINCMNGDESATLFKMKDLWTYLSTSFNNSESHLKQIRKSNSFIEYKVAVGKLFRECELKG
jgi:hypothetical protein